MTYEETPNWIEGAAQVISHYGEWPTFHDADFVSICLDMAGPTVEMEFRLYDWVEVIGKAKRPRIVLAWQQVESISLSGIDTLGNNSIGSMEMTGASEAGNQFLDTVISSTGNGTDVQLRAGRVVVKTFEPDDDFLHEKTETWIKEPLLR